MILYVPVEVKNRELESRFLLGYRAAEDGWDVYLGRLDDLKDISLLNLLPPGVFFEKSIQNDKRKHLHRLTKQGSLVVIQDEEGGLLDKDYERFAESRFSDRTLDLTTRVYTWGELDAQTLRNKFPHQAEKILVTGSPRVDLWTNRFSNFHSTQISSIIKDYSPFILISSNFSIVHPYSPTEAKIKSLEKANPKGVKDPLNFYRNLLFEQNELTSQLVSLIRVLVADFPEVNVVVRPHPAEDPTHWNKKLAGIQRCFVIRKGDTTPWVKASNLVIHNGCTTGIEATIARIPAVAFCPFYSTHERYFPNFVSYRAESIDQVVSYANRLSLNVPKCASKNHEADDQLAGINYRYHCNSDVSAMERIIGDLRLFQSRYIGFRKHYWKKTCWTSLLLLKAVARWLRRRIFRRKSPADNKFPRLTKNEVQGLAAASKSVSAAGKSIEVKIEAPNIVRIRQDPRGDGKNSSRAEQRLDS